MKKQIVTIIEEFSEFDGNWQLLAWFFEKVLFIFVSI